MLEALFFSLFEHPHPRARGATAIYLARFARLTYVGKSAGHQLASPADLPIKADLSAYGIPPIS